MGGIRSGEAGGLKVADGFIPGNGSELAPGRRIDAVRDKLDVPIDEYDVHATCVLAASGTVDFVRLRSRRVARQVGKHSDAPLLARG
jgi:hypothetical protein